MLQEGALSTCDSVDGEQGVKQAPRLHQIGWRGQSAKAREGARREASAGRRVQRALQRRGLAAAGWPSHDCMLFRRTVKVPRHCSDGDRYSYPCGIYRSPAGTVDGPWLGALVVLGN